MRSAARALTLFTRLLPVWRRGRRSHFAWPSAHRCAAQGGHYPCRLLYHGGARGDHL